MTDKKPLRVFVKGNDDLRSTLLAKDSGGSNLDQGLAEKLLSEFGGAGRIEILHEPSHGVAAWMTAMDTARSVEDGTALYDFAPDIVITSIVPEIELMTAPETEARDRFEQSATILIDRIKEEVGAHILIYNPSSVDRSRHVSNYHGLDEEPVTLRIHRLSLALLQLSNMEGISIIDVDRIIAEIGAAANVDQSGAFSEQACVAIRDEVARVLDDYGFFDERELVVQMGRRSRST